MNAAEIAHALGNMRRERDGWRCRCPLAVEHNNDDADPSFTIVESDGKLLVRCYSRHADEQDRVINALRDARLWPERVRTAKITAIYDYRDEASALLYQVVRLSPKGFRQRRPNGAGWVYDLDSVRRVLYRLPELLAAPDAPVFIVEGEKDADNLLKLGLLATTNAGGAGKWRTDYNAALAGREVVILPDKDSPGQKHAIVVARSLLDTAKSVRIIELPSLPIKGDVSDWLSAGGTREQLADLVRAAKCLTAQNVAETHSSPSPPTGFVTVQEYLSEINGRSAKKSYWAGILREGEISILVGRAMAGKSTFACALTRALYHGLLLLGRECTKAKVAYMALERNGAAVARLFDTWKLADLAFLDEIQPTMPLEELARFIEAEIVDLKLEVVIVDHLQNLTRVPDGNDYATVSNMLAPLAAIAKRTGCHIVLLHHQGKTRREGEIDVMGSEAYRASADVLIEATANDGTHFIRAQIRGAADLPKTRVNVDLETGEVEGIDAHQAEVSDAGTEILRYLDEQDEPHDADTIQLAIETKREIVRAALRAAYEAGNIGRSGAGKRGDPFLYFRSQPVQGTAGTETEKDENLNAHKGLFRSQGHGNGNDRNLGSGTESVPSDREDF